jgi:hypothetical protein
VQTADLHIRSGIWQGQCGAAVQWAMAAMAAVRLDTPKFFCSALLMGDLWYCSVIASGRGRYIQRIASIG